MFCDVCKSFSVGLLTGLHGPSRSFSFRCSLSSVNQYSMAGTGKLPTNILASQPGAALPHRHFGLGKGLNWTKKIWITHSLLLQFMTKDSELHTHTATFKTGKTVAKPGKRTQAECWQSRCVDPLAQLHIKGGWYWLCGERERESSRPVVETESRQEKQLRCCFTDFLVHRVQLVISDLVWTESWSQPLWQKPVNPGSRDFGSQICQPLCDDKPPLRFTLLSSFRKKCLGPETLWFWIWTSELIISQANQCKYGRAAKK